MATNAIMAFIMALGIIGGLGFGATMDLDNDGIANMEDADDDADGINDTEDEYPRDHDNDGIPDCKDDDDDNDGINDTEDDEYVGNCSKPVRRPHRRGFSHGHGPGFGSGPGLGEARYQNQNGELDRFLEKRMI